LQEIKINPLKMKHLQVALLLFSAIVICHAQTKPEEMENQKTYTCFEIKDLIGGQGGAFLEFNELFKKEAR
jgi:hypothetical protein